MSTLGQRLKNARMAAGMTQAQLAWRMELQVFTLQKWETDRVTPRSHNLHRVCRCLGITMDEILEGVEMEEVVTLRTRPCRPKKSG